MVFPCVSSGVSLNNIRGIELLIGGNDSGADHMDIKVVETFINHLAESKA